MNIYWNVALQKGLQKIYKSLKERSFAILETTWNNGKVNIDSTARLSKSSIPNDVRSNSGKEAMSGVFFCTDIKHLNEIWRHLLKQLKGDEKLWLIFIWVCIIIADSVSLKDPLHSFFVLYCALLKTDGAGSLRNSNSNHSFLGFLFVIVSILMVFHECCIDNIFFKYFNGYCKVWWHFKLPYLYSWRVLFWRTATHFLFFLELQQTWLNVIVLSEPNIFHPQGNFVEAMLQVHLWWYTYCLGWMPSTVPLISLFVSLWGIWEQFHYCS